MNDLKISTRLVIMLGTLSLLLIIIGTIGLLGIRQSNHEIKALHDQAMAPALMADESIDQLVQNRMQVLLAFQHAPGNPLAAIHDHATGTHLDAIATNRTEANRITAALQTLAKNPEEKALLQKAQNTRNAWREKLDQVSHAIEAGDFSPTTMALFLKAGREEGEDALKALRAYRDYQVQQAHHTYQAAEERYRHALMGFSMAILLGLLAAGMIGASTIQFLGHQLGGEPGAAAAVARRVGAGDLNVPVHTKPGDSTSLMAQLQSMQSNLGHVVTQVRQGSESVAAASAQIASGNHDLSTRTETQAGALQETSASMEQLSATVRQNADNARQANQLALHASGVAARGGEVVAQVVDTMQQINAASHRISEITGVIDGIAFQTNILALNAAVEAARAGEQGRGFAVVASEVRALAIRSADAAKSIKGLIGANVSSVEQGSALVGQAGVTMAEVVDSIGRVTDIMGAMSIASDEQSLGVSQINQAVAQMDQVTQQNSAMVEEMAAAASSLKIQAQELLKTVEVFNLPHAASNAVAVATPSTPSVASARVPTYAPTPRPAVTPAPNSKLTYPQPPALATAKAKAPTQATGHNWEAEMLELFFDKPGATTTARGASVR
ncbi:MAG: Tar ligand binding domain-containing protein [Burkholderiaceae bacterium]|nr:Tar ligand binding domain-containing protein [Burkholderiaceae bacterium]